MTPFQAFAHRQRHCSLIVWPARIFARRARGRYSGTAAGRLASLTAIPITPISCSLHMLSLGCHADQSIKPSNVLFCQWSLMWAPTQSPRPTKCGRAAAGHLLRSRARQPMSRRQKPSSHCTWSTPCCGNRNTRLNQEQRHAGMRCLAECIWLPMLGVLHPEHREGSEMVNMSRGISAVQITERASDA